MGYSAEGCKDTTVVTVVTEHTPKSLNSEFSVTVQVLGYKDH